MEMGLGKSREALACLALNKRIRCLLVAGKNLFPHWGQEIEKHSNFSYVVVKGNRQQKIDILNDRGYHIFLINPEQVRRLAQPLAECADDFDSLVVDEMTRFRRRSQQTRALKIVAWQIPLRVGLSGGLVSERLTDVFNPFLMVDMGRSFGRSFVAFRHKYMKQEYTPIEVGDPDPRQFKWTPTPYGKRTVRGILQRNAFLASARDYLPDLPPERFSRRVISLSKEQNAALKELQESWSLSITGQEMKYVIELVQKARQIASGFVYKEDGTVHWFDYNPRIQELVGVLEELGGKPFVIWCCYKAEVALIKGLLKSLGKKICENWEDFDKDDSDAYIAQINKDFEGIELQKKTNQVIYFSRPWSWNQYNQSKKRHLRKGSEHHPFINYTIITSNSKPDRMVDRILKKKHELEDYIREVGTADLWKALETPHP